MCFNCNDKFTAGHKCTKAQLLILECGTTLEEGLNEEFVVEELHGEENKREQPGKTRHRYNNNFLT